MVKTLRWIARGFGIILVGSFVGNAFEVGFVITEIDYFKAVTIHLGDLLMILTAVRAARICPILVARTPRGNTLDYCWHSIDSNF